MRQWQRHWSRGSKHARLRLIIGGIALIAAGLAGCLAIDGTADATDQDAPGLGRY